MNKYVSNTEQIPVRAGSLNVLTTFAVRYALGRETLAPDSIRNIIQENLPYLNEQTKQGIVRDIMDYIDQNDTLPSLSTWQCLVRELQHEERNE